MNQVWALSLSLPLPISLLLCQFSWQWSDSSHVPITFPPNSAYLRSWRWGCALTTVEYQFNGFLQLCQNGDIVQNTSLTGQNWAGWSLENGLSFISLRICSVCLCEVFSTFTMTVWPYIGEFKQRFCNDLQSFVLESVGRNRERGKSCTVSSQKRKWSSSLGLIWVIAAV